MSETRTASHLPILDGLRGIAVLLVLWAHLSPAMPGYPEWLLKARFLHDPGIQGVDLFFVLSGFLITRILLLEHEQAIPVRWFLLRRVLRIFPVYYLLLVIVWATRGGPDIGWCAVYLSNFYFAFGGGVTSLTHTWSLCVEEHFYLLWPPILALAGPAAARRFLVWLVGPLAIASVVLALYLLEPATAELAQRYTSPVRFFSLGVGCLLAFGEGRIHHHPRRYAWLGITLLLLGALSSNAALVVLPMMNSRAPLLPPSLFQASYLLSAVLLSTGTMLCCLCAGRYSPLQLLRAAPLRAVGRISYGLYLYHMPIFRWLGEPATLGSQTLAVATSFAAATASYFAIERPILRFGARFRGARRHGAKPV
ncbi:MAG: acyltransferase [Planctomycetes bacterium]|nr:acyltransferase [Planctomycetota bacterium]